jgi:hypothetical protein
VAAIVATLIVIGILLVVLKADPANDLVDTMREVARFFAQPFDRDLLPGAAPPRDRAELGDRRRGLPRARSACSRG